jgi:hypothetical protein
MEEEMTNRFNVIVPIVMMLAGFTFDSASSRTPPTVSIATTIPAVKTKDALHNFCMETATDIFNDNIVELQKLAAEIPLNFEMYRRAWIAITAGKICDRMEEK